MRNIIILYIANKQGERFHSNVKVVLWLLTMWFLNTNVEVSLPKDWIFTYNYPSFLYEYCVRSQSTPFHRNNRVSLTNQKQWWVQDLTLGDGEGGVENQSCLIILKDVLSIFHFKLCLKWIASKASEKYWGHFAFWAQKNHMSAAVGEPPGAPSPGSASAKMFSDMLSKLTSWVDNSWLVKKMNIRLFFDIKNYNVLFNSGKSYWPRYVYSVSRFDLHLAFINKYRPI